MTDAVRPSVAGDGMSAPAAGRRPNLPSLTGARWWAAFAVFILHALVFLPVYPFQKTELFANIHSVIPMQLGSAGVTFFFVLSGFIIYWSNGNMSNVRRYLKRRVLKIYPTHIVASVVFIVAASVPLSKAVVWVPNLLLIHTWVPRWTTLGGLNVPSWSLVAELLFYLSFPLFVPLVRKVTGAGIWWAIGGLFTLIVLLHLGYYLFLDGPTGIQNAFLPRFWPGDVSPNFEIHASPEWFAQNDIPVFPSYWMTYNFPLSRLPEFYLGVMAAKLVIEGRWRNKRMSWPLGVLAASYAATWVVPVNFKMSVLFLIPMMMVVATLAVKDIEGNTGISGSPTMVRLGDISFAFYLIQFPVMVIVTRLFIGGNQYYFRGWLGWTVLTFVISVVAAWLIYTFIDDPIMKRAARPKKRPQPGPGPSEDPRVSPMARSLD
ncbi:MAG: acyltransferase [Micrococcales bacterium]|nr:acyltransferase [Micrococcales bacterium]